MQLPGVPSTSLDVTFNSDEDKNERKEKIVEKETSNLTNAEALICIQKLTRHFQSISEKDKKVHAALVLLEKTALRNRFREICGLPSE